MKTKQFQSVAGKTFRYIKIDIGALFIMLLILRQLEKMLDIIVKRMKKIDSKHKVKHSVALENLSDTSNLIYVRRLLCCQSLGGLKKCWTSLQNE